MRQRALRLASRFADPFTRENLRIWWERFFLANGSPQLRNYFLRGSNGGSALIHGERNRAHPRMTPSAIALTDFSEVHFGLLWRPRIRSD